MDGKKTNVSSIDSPVLYQMQHAHPDRVFGHLSGRTVPARAHLWAPHGHMHRESASRPRGFTSLYQGARHAGLTRGGRGVM